MRIRSPHNLVQERFQHDPWKMLVLCIMLNQTSYKQVHPVKDEFFERWPTPQKAIRGNKKKMIEVLRPLGFYNRRTNIIKKFSKQYISLNWQDVGDLYGIGKYARDSWLIFQENQLPQDVTDKELKKYVNWANTQPSLI